MYNGKHNTINHLQQAQPVQNEWECSYRPSTLLAFRQSLLFKDKIKRGKVMCETLHSKAIQIHAPFKCSKKFLQPEGSCNRRQGSYQYKHKKISIQIHAPFECSKNWFSLKVAAIEDKGHINTSTNNINTNTCTFQVFQEVWISLKVAAIEDKGHINTSSK